MFKRQHIHHRDFYAFHFYLTKIFKCLFSVVPLYMYVTVAFQLVLWLLLSSLLLIKAHTHAKFARI